MNGLHIEDEEKRVQDSEAAAEESLVDSRLFCKHAYDLESMPGIEGRQEPRDEE